jgi:hypothetical protein
MRSQIAFVLSSGIRLSMNLSLQYDFFTNALQRLNPNFKNIILYGIYISE